MQPPPAAPDSLPEPDADSRAHSARVARHLREAIRTAGGALPFGDFMQEALYAPGLGYYAAGAQKFGASGDFVTAPELSPLFGRVLARQLAAALADGDHVLELGAGSGALAVELLAGLERLDCLPERYDILEVSPELAARQRRRLADDLPGLAGRVRWLDSLPAGFRGVIVANEVADALPVERFRRDKDGVTRLGVVEDGEAFGWHDLPAPGWLADRVMRLEETLGARLPAGYVSELSPGLPAWIGDIAAALEEGVVVLFDYGTSRREYYAPERHGGWLRCHFRHRAHNDPLVLPGIQDLTAWVDFTAIAEAAVDAGLDVNGYTTQAQFLLHGGLAEEMADFDALDEKARAELSRQVKLLTLPGEMGEHFKCMALGRHRDGLPPAVAIADQSHRL